MARRGPSALGRHTGHGEGTIGHGKGAPATGDGRRSDLQAPAMEVLEVGDDSDMWVPHVSGVGRVRVGGREGHDGDFLRRRVRGNVCSMRSRSTSAERIYLNAVSNKSGKYVR
jgi:hypothetical protein